MVIQSAANKFRSLLQSWGTGGAKKWLWDHEFANGRWDYIENTADDLIYPILSRHARGGSILDLGCGSGNTGNELPWESYDAYHGVDISGVAVEKARIRSAAGGRAAKNSYAQSDVFSYAPSAHYDLILFRESIFYVPLSKIVRMLHRYQGFLKPGGVFVVRMCDRQRYARILELIQENFAVVEDHRPDDVTTVAVVFRGAVS